MASAAAVALTVVVAVGCSRNAGTSASAPDSGVAPEAVRTTSSTTGMLPDVLLSDLEGNPVPLPSVADGSVTVLNYWYAACPPCKEEMPAFGQVAREFNGRVTFVGINPQDDASTARTVAEERGTGYRQLLDSTQRSVDALGLTGFPTTIIVRADGTIALSLRRALTADELRAMLGEVLAA